MSAVTLGRPIPQTIDEIIVYLQGDFDGLKFYGGLYIDGRGWVVAIDESKDGAQYLFECNSIFQLYKIAHFGLKAALNNGN